MGIPPAQTDALEGTHHLTLSCPSHVSAVIHEDCGLFPLSGMVWATWDLGLQAWFSLGTSLLVTPGRAAQGRSLTQGLPRPAVARPWPGGPHVTDVTSKGTR